MKIDQYDKVYSIWLEFKGKLYAYILKLVRDPELAEEVNQEVLFKLLGACCSNKEIKNLPSWLYQIAYNTAIDYLKAGNKFNELADTEIEKDGSSKAYSEMAEYLEPLLSFLPEKYAVPLELSDIKKVKQKEIAESLGLSLTSTKTRIQRARKLLKKEIEECFHIEGNDEPGLTAFKVKSSCKPLRNKGLDCED